MLSVQRTALVALLLLLTTSLPAWATLKNGTQAPAFELQGQDGNKHKLSDFSGKIVVLEWFNNKCPFVEKYYSVGKMQELQNKYKDKGVVWLTIISSGPDQAGYVKNFEEMAEAKKFYREVKSEASFMLFDPTGSVGHSYDAKTTPHMFIIDDKGAIVYQGAIDDQPSPKPESLNEKTKNYVADYLDYMLAAPDAPKGKKAPKAPKAKSTPYGCGIKYADVKKKK